MSKALKCDRCGTCFDPTTGGDEEYVYFYNPLFRSANSRKECTRTRYLYENKAADDDIDLCPSCTRAFEKFMACDDTYHAPEVPLEGYKTTLDGDELARDVLSAIDRDEASDDDGINDLGDVSNRLTDFREKLTSSFDKFIRPYFSNTQISGGDTDGDII